MLWTRMGLRFDRRGLFLPGGNSEIDRRGLLICPAGIQKLMRGYFSSVDTQKFGGGYFRWAESEIKFKTNHKQCNQEMYQLRKFLLGNESQGPARREMARKRITGVPPDGKRLTIHKQSIMMN